MTRLLSEMKVGNDDHEELEALRKQVLMQVGVTLARYQKIEWSLKALMPFLVAEGREPTGDPFSEMRELLASKSTLGQLIERLKECISSRDPEYVAGYLEAVIGHRNELVHHFFQLPIGRLSDTDGCREALKHLKDRLEYAQPLLELLNGSAKSLLEMYEPTQEQSAH